MVEPRNHSLGIGWHSSGLGPFATHMVSVPLMSRCISNSARVHSRCWYDSGVHGSPVSWWVHGGTTATKACAREAYTEIAEIASSCVARLLCGTEE